MLRRRIGALWFLEIYLECLAINTDTSRLPDWPGQNGILKITDVAAKWMNIEDLCHEL